MSRVSGKYILRAVCGMGRFGATEALDKDWKADAAAICLLNDVGSWAGRDFKAERRASLWRLRVGLRRVEAIRAMNSYASELSIRVGTIEWRKAV